MMMIARNWGKKRGIGEGGVYGKKSGEEENAYYGGMVQPSQQHVVPCVKGVEWGLDTRGLKIVAAFWAGIPVSST